MTKPTKLKPGGRTLSVLLLLMTWMINAYAQPKISGQVLSSDDGQPLPGVSVSVKNSNVATSTNIEGRYSITASGGDVLIFKFIGYEDQQVSVGKNTTINVTLKTMSKALNEVVVIGYGTQKKANVTGALSTFNTESIQDRPVTRVDQALVGQMPGVTVKQTTGAPGKAFSIQVRGSASISASNEPLYVIDGFPLATAGPNASGSYATGNPLDNINPNDIESIQVLKDAASTAIYGSRGGNGVILITTKRGKSGKPEINFNTNVGSTEAAKKLDMLSATEWIDRATEMINAAYVSTYGSKGAKATDDYETRRQILNIGVTASKQIQAGQYNTSYMLDDRWFQPNYGGLKFIDWQDEAFRTGLSQNYQLSARGGTDAVSYFISGNYAGNEGMVKALDYTLYSTRANIEVRPNNKLKLGLNLSPSYSITNDPGVEGKDNILHQLISFTPVQLNDAGDVNVFGNDKYPWSTSANSSIAKLNYNIGQTKRFRTLATAYGEYQIIKGLNFRTTFNLDNTDNTTKSYSPYSVNVTSLATRLASPNVGTSGSLASYRKQTFVNENTLNYNTTINKAHDITLLAGASYNSDNIYISREASNGGYNYSDITTLNAAAGITGTSTETKNVLISYFGRAQYAYKSKYLLSASLRTDGSSRFGANTKWGTFPSASIGWNISKEAFIENLHVISDMKLRSSYGETGNYNIGDYSSIATLSPYNYSFNGASAAGQTQGGIVNPDLTWEKTRTFDFGIDFGVLSNKLTGSVDFYTKNTSDLLLNVPILSTTGFSSYLSNSGEVNNRGWEFELTSRNITKKDFSWTTTANLTHTRNKLVSLPGDQRQIIIPSSYGDAAIHSILQVGQPLYSIYVLRRTGVLSQADISNGVALYTGETAGDPKYFDANGDGVINTNDRVIVGKPNPNYTWGLTNALKYKKFDLSFLIQGQQGGSIYSLLGRAIYRTGQGATDNALGIVRDRWRSDTDPGNGMTSKAYTSTSAIANTDWLYSSDYWRVRNITLGYNLASALKAKQVRNARIYITAENYFGHDKYYGGFNPEANNTDVSGSTSFPEAGDYGGLPLPKSLVLGLNMTF